MLQKRGWMIPTSLGMKRKTHSQHIPVLQTGTGDTQQLQGQAQPCCMEWAFCPQSCHPKERRQQELEEERVQE